MICIHISKNMDNQPTKTLPKIDQLESSALLKEKAEKALAKMKSIEQMKLESGNYEYVKLDAKTTVLRKKQIL